VLHASKPVQEQYEYASGFLLRFSAAPFLHVS